MGGFPAFSIGRGWRKRGSHATQIDRRVHYDPTTDYEYEPDPNPAKNTWHEIDYRHGMYRDVDPTTGDPVDGSEGAWRPLR